MSTPEQVLSYWFPEDIVDGDPQTLRHQMERWMGGSAELDREITERFGEVLEQARRGELDHWAETTPGRLALIVVLDQFSRRVYRGSPLSYAQDKKALRLAVEGIDLGMERELTDMERMFFWLPLGHSEDLTLHERGVSHLEEEVADAPEHLRGWREHNLYQAKAARNVIARFGRHPHRNELLDRGSTPQELEYLRTETPPHLRRPPS